MFEILACDFMFSENLDRNWLIDIVSNPSFCTRTSKVLCKVNKALITKTLDNVLKFNELMDSSLGQYKFAEIDFAMEGFEVLINK